MSRQSERRGRTLLVGFGFVVLLFAGGVAGPATPAHAGECATWKPGWVFCDDFEDGTWLDTWDSSIYCCDRNGDGLISRTEQEAVDTGGFNSTYAAWNVRPGEQWVYDGFGYDGHWGRSPIPQGNEYYIRWYTYISNPFTWADTGDKNMILTHNDGNADIINPYVGTNAWGTGKPNITNYNNSGTPCVNQTTPNIFGEYSECVNRHQNVGNDITLQKGKWYLFEWYVKLNDPGVANGMTKLWVDDASGPITSQTLRTSYTDMMYRTTSHMPNQIYPTTYHQTNNPGAGAYEKWDQIVVSRTPIGPIGSTPPCPLRGDLDCSGKVDLDDLRRMIYMLVGTVPKDLLKADLDGDGQLLLADLQALVKILVGIP